MKKFYSYTRVSTLKQGEHGVSLQEQVAAIERFALRNGLLIEQRFEEKETAAKQGRPVFGQMLRRLRAGEASGVIIHKIDRSARNLRDWAELGELIDAGIEVHFANEALDLNSRGGRLSADIQAVVAADYVRNLREETRKGFYGRLKQGVLPMPAPVGYLNVGPGKPKAIDPVKGPLVKEAFESYSTARYTLKTLLAELARRGLSNRSGGKMTRSGLSSLLNNPFYTGLIRIEKTKQTFPGSHPRLISTALFNRVQQVLSGKYNRRSFKHDFLFRRWVVCQHCGYRLIGETRKGFVYYRCHTQSCSGTSIRHEVIDAEVRRTLVQLKLTEEEELYLPTAIRRFQQNWDGHKEAARVSLALKRQNVQERLARLTDAYLDGVLDRDLLEDKKKTLLMERQQLEEAAENIEQDRDFQDELSEILELAKDPVLAYETQDPDEKREMLRTVTSNCLADHKTLVITLRSPFAEIATRFENQDGGPSRDVRRTCMAVLLMANTFLRTVKESAEYNPMLSWIQDRKRKRRDPNKKKAA